MSSSLLSPRTSGATARKVRSLHSVVLKGQTSGIRPELDSSE